MILLLYSYNRVYEYMGPAWYQREITIPKEWKGKRIFISFERPDRSISCVCAFNKDNWVINTNTIRMDLINFGKNFIEIKSDIDIPYENNTDEIVIAIPESTYRFFYIE